MTLTRHGVRGLKVYLGFLWRDAQERRCFRGACVCVCAASPRQYISIVPTTTGLAATAPATAASARCRLPRRPAALQQSRRTPRIRGLARSSGFPSGRITACAVQEAETSHSLAAAKCCLVHAATASSTFRCPGVVVGRRPASADDSTECRFLHVSPTCRRLRDMAQSCRNAHARARERPCDWVGKQPGYGNASAHFNSVPTTRHPPRRRPPSSGWPSRDVSLRR